MKIRPHFMDELCIHVGNSKEFTFFFLALFISWTKTKAKAACVPARKKSSFLFSFIKIKKQRLYCSVELVWPSIIIMINKNVCDFILMLSCLIA